MSHLLQTEEPLQSGLRPAAEDAPALEFANSRRPRSLRRLILAPEGLIEVWGRKTLTIPWDEIYGVSWRDSHVRIRYASRTLCVGARFGDWQRLGREVEARAVLLRPDTRPTAVTPERIAEWLGIPIDGRVVCGFKHRKLLGWGLISLYLLVVVGSAAGGNGANAGSMVMVLMMGVAALVSADNVSADVHGLSLRVGGKPMTYAWSEIRKVSDGGQSLSVETDRGKFSLANSLPNSAKLLLTIRHIAASQELGLELPDERPIAETAISRSGGEPTEAALERGLSRGDDAA